MNAKDFRIGNIVEQGKIDVIDNSLNEVYYWSDGNYLSESCITINPIPINEELLIKMGAIKKTKTRGEYYLFKGDIGLHRNMFLEGFYVKPFGKDIICSVVYVHQLQNLYFALTGSELTVA